MKTIIEALHEARATATLQEDELIKQFVKMSYQDQREILIRGLLRASADADWAKMQLVANIKDKQAEPAK